MAAITAISTFVKQGDHVVCSNMTYGGTYRYYTKILRELRRDVRLRRHGGSGGGRAGDPARDAHAASRVPDEPDDAPRGHHAPLGARSPCRRHRRRRQHLLLALPPEAVVSRGGHRHALDDEVPGRPLRHGRRNRDREGQGARRVAGLRPEQLGRDPLADGFLSRPARHQDARRPHGAARGQRPKGRRAPREASEGPARSTIPASRRIPSTRSRRNRCRGSAR